MVAFSVVSTAVATLAFAAGDDVEIFVGGWNSHNVLRIDWETGALIDVFVSPGEGGVSRPHDISVGPDGSFYIASYGNSSVRSFTPGGDFIEVFIPAGNGLINSHTVFWNFDDTILVASEGGDRVNQYDDEGNFMEAFVVAGESGLDGPEWIIEMPGGDLLLSGQSNEVYRLDPESGGVIEEFVSAAGNGGLSWGHGMAFSPHSGNLLVASSNTSQVKEYDGETGVYLGNFVGAGAGGVGFPIGVAFGPDGHLYVSSFSNSRILRYDGESGDPLGLVANLATFGLNGPLGIRFLPSPDVAGDVNGDGVTDVSDLTEVIVSWGPCDACPADLDGDGAVGVGDLVLVVLNWN